MAKSSKTTINQVRKLSAKASVRRLSMKPGDANAGMNATQKAGSAILSAQSRGVKLPTKLSTDSNKKSIRKRVNQSRIALGTAKPGAKKKEEKLLPLYKGKNNG